MAPSTLISPHSLHIKATLLTPQFYSPFGHIIQNPSAYLTSSSASSPTTSAIPSRAQSLAPSPSPSPLPSSTPTPAATVNQGTAKKYLRITPFTNNYPLTSPRASANINLFVCTPRTLLPPGNLFQVKILERHPYTTQTFTPLGLSPSSAISKYLVIVAPSLPQDHDTKQNQGTPLSNLPDLKNLQAFIAYGNQGVTYSAGTWHAPMVALGDKEIEFVVLNYENGVEGEDTQEVEIVGGEVLVELPREGGWLWEKKEKLPVKL